MTNSSKTVSTWMQTIILTVMAMLLAALIFIADISTPSEIAVGALYAIVVLYGWVLPGNFSSVYTAMVCSALLLTSIVISYEEGMHGQASSLNHLISFVVIWICSSLVSIAKRSFQGMEKNKTKLEEKIKERTKLLKASETKLRQMTEEVEDYAILLLDSNGNIDNWNKGAMRVCGYEEVEIIGFHIEKFFTSEDIRKGIPDELIRKAAREGRIYDEGWRVRKDGTRYWASNTITAIYNMNGTISGFSNVTNDLTKRKLSEETIKKSENLMRSVFESVNDAIITIDAKGRIQSWNRGAVALFGYTSEEILEQHITTIMPNRYLEKFYRELESFLSSGINSIVGKTMELDCVAKDQTVFPSEVSIGSWEVNGKYFFCGIIRDISKRREVEKAMQSYNRQLEAQNRELEQFAYIASHDLQEPLRTVTNYTQLLQGKYADQFDELGNKSMHYISDATNRMRQLIKGLLDYSRIGRNREIRRVNCNRILSTVIDDLGSMVKESKALIEVRHLPEIKANEMELRMLFQNLITNAIKFRKKQSIPQIRIWAEEENYLNFHIKDNGIGIAREHTDKIFIIFQRLKSRKDYEGTGIGLAHCRKIVESHGGKIWVDSTPEEGSVFHFTMPNQS